MQPRAAKGWVAQAVEHGAENAGVGGSTPPPAICHGPPTAGSREAAEGRSSIGRAPVSKTGGWGFESLRPCRSRSSGVERILGKDEVAGSIPAASLRQSLEQRGNRPAGARSSVGSEHRPSKPGVPGSSPGGRVADRDDGHSDETGMSPHRPTARTPLFQGGDRGSIPLGGMAEDSADGNGDSPSAGSEADARGRSSAGRALQWHCRGQGFESPRLHFAARRDLRRRARERGYDVVRAVSSIGRATDS